jgi:hypothetical protein
MSIITNYIGINKMFRVYRVQQGDFQREREDEERAKGGGGTGGGGGRWERQKEITVHEINIIVPKGINKNGELSSVQGTQGLIFATTVAGFPGFRMILLPYSQGEYTVYDIFYALSTF